MKNIFEVPCLVLSSINFFILGLTILYLVMKNHLLKFKLWEQVTLYCFFLSQTLRFLSWLYVYISERTFTDLNNTAKEIFILTFLDDTATLLGWAVLMYFVFSIQELRVVLESQTSQAMIRGMNRSRKVRNALIGNLIAMNVLIIGCETYAEKDREYYEKHAWMKNVPFTAYVIECLGDILALYLFASLLSYFTRVIRLARESAGDTFGSLNKIIIFGTWTLVIMDFMTSISYLVQAYI